MLPNKLGCNMFYKVLENVNNQTSKNDNEKNKKHTNIQSNKRSIKQTIRQAHHQSNQTKTNKQNEKTRNKKPYISNYATPDRPPPAAAMLSVAIVLVIGSIDTLTDNIDCL